MKEVTEAPVPRTINKGVAALFANGGVLPTDATAPRRHGVPAKDGLCMLSVDQLDDYPNQPFLAYSSEQLEQLRQSICSSGVLSPLLVRPMGARYEIISGHNRRTAAKLAGFRLVPCMVRELSDEDAAVQMVDANLRQRERLLPSEKARAYRLRLEAMNRQGERSDLTSPQLAGKLESNDALGKEFSISGDTILRYIRLTYLIPALLKLVDEKRIGLTVGASLSYLSEESQACVHKVLVMEHPCAIDQKCADKLRALKAEPITENDLAPLLALVADKPLKKISIPMNLLAPYFGPEVTEKEIRATIKKAMEAYNH